MFGVQFHYRNLSPSSKLALVVGFSLCWAAAFCSKGIFHYDEHFQILEFAGFKLQRVSEDALAWEFKAFLRPWLQPLIFTSLYQLTDFLASTQLSTKLFLWRLLSACLGFSSILVLMGFYLREMPRILQERLLWCLSLFAPLPMLFSRNSSEMLAAICLNFATALLLYNGLSATKLRRTKPVIYGVVGFLIGLAFEFRFPSLVMAAGLLFYFLCVRGIRQSRKPFFWIGLGFLVCLALELWVDYWGYGTLVFPPYNYFKFNILQHHVVENIYGTSPFWHYGPLLYYSNIFFPSSLLIATPLLFWFFFPLHPLTALSLPFCLLHMFLGHKELRFLFPIFPFFPFFFVMVLERLSAHWLWLRLHSSKLLVLLLLLSLSRLYTLTFQSLSIDIAVAEYLYDQAPDKLTLYYTSSEPMIYGGSYVQFYMPKDFKSVKLYSFEEFKHIVQEKPQEALVFVRNVDSTLKDPFQRLSLPGCRSKIFTRNPLSAAIIDYVPLKKINIREILFCHGL